MASAEKFIFPWPDTQSVYLRVESFRLAMPVFYICFTPGWRKLEVGEENIGCWPWTRATIGVAL